MFVALAACSGGGGSDGSWDEGVDDYVEASCVEFEPCTGTDPADCEADVRADLGDARDELDDAGEQECLDCLAAKSEAVRGALPGCQPDAADVAAVLAACDTDPTFDFDNDGTPDNDDDEACNGHP